MDLIGNIVSRNWDNQNETLLFVFMVRLSPSLILQTCHPLSIHLYLLVRSDLDLTQLDQSWNRDAFLYPSSSQSCPAGWLGPHRSTCYKLSDTRMTWMKANATGCLEMDPRAHLAAVTYENRAFISKQSEVFSKSYWAGLQSSKPAWNFGTDYATPVDGSVSWGSLSRPRPRHVGSPDMDCVFVNSFDGSWNDDSTCDTETLSLCQLKQVRSNPSHMPTEPYSWRRRERLGHVFTCSII